MRLTYRQGQTLLRMASTCFLPERLGPETFAHSVRAMADDEIRTLRRTLLEISPESRGTKVQFGDPECWKDGVLVDKDAFVEIQIKGAGLNGAYWLVLLMLHPNSPVRLDPINADEIAWTLAAELKIAGQIKKDLGLGPDSKRLELDP